MTTVEASSATSPVTDTGAVAPVASTTVALNLRSTTLNSVLGIAITVAIWELLRAVGVLPSQSAPSIPTILSTTWSGLFSSEDGSFGGELLTALWRTSRTWALGLGVSTLVAVPIGLLVGMSRWADAITGVLFDFVRPVPAVAFVPVAIVFFGLGGRTETFLIVLASVWPIVYNVRLGIQSVDPLLIETARTLRLGSANTMRRVRIPSLIPALFTGLRISAGIAVVLTVVAELVATGRGLGHYIEINRQGGLFAEAWAGLFVTGAFGYVVAVMFSVTERRLASWHHLSKRSTE